MINFIFALVLGIIVGALGMFFVLKDGYKQVGGK